jgi:hypothetical protein
MSPDYLSAERERIALMVEEFDEFEYREVSGYGSVVDERPSMNKLAGLIRSAP